MNKHFADGEPNYSGLRRRASRLVLVLANLLPRAGVLVCDWAVAGLMVLYRAGDLVPGFYTLLKMLTKSPLGVFLQRRERRKLASTRTG